MFRASAESKFNSGSENEKEVNFPPEFIFPFSCFVCFKGLTIKAMFSWWWWWWWWWWSKKMHGCIIRNA